MRGNWNYFRGGKQYTKEYCTTTHLLEYTHTINFSLNEPPFQEFSYAEYDPDSHKYNKMLTLLWAAEPPYCIANVSPILS